MLFKLCPLFRSNPFIPASKWLKPLTKLSRIIKICTELRSGCSFGRQCRFRNPGASINGVSPSPTLKKGLLPRPPLKGASRNWKGWFSYICYCTEWPYLFLNIALQQRLSPDDVNVEHSFHSFHSSIGALLSFFFYFYYYFIGCGKNNTKCFIWDIASVKR